MSHNRNFRRAALGVTLIELMLAISIVGVISTAVAVLLTGAGRTHQYINRETEAMAQVENAYRRIMHNVRTASAITTPSNGTLASPGTITLTTQADTGYPSGSTVTYSISNGNLVENDQRFGTNIILSGVATFSVQRTNTSPTRISVTITSNTTPAVTRTAIIACRNL